MNKVVKIVLIVFGVLAAAVGGLYYLGLQEDKRLPSDSIYTHTR